ncbi:MAG: hypothetical protein ACFFD2_01875, partial [Promethearchaeota archaeon]
MSKSKKRGKKSIKKSKKISLESKIDSLKSKLRKIVLDGLEFIQSNGFKLIPKDNEENKLSKEEFEFISGIVFNPYYKEVDYTDLTKVYGRFF